MWSVGLLFSIASLASSIPLESRQSGYDMFVCDGTTNPDADDCTALYSQFSDPTGTIRGKAGVVYYYTDGDTSNCQVAIGFTQDYVLTYAQLNNGLDAVHEGCISRGAGGRAESSNNDFAVAVNANPDFRANPDSRSKLRARADGDDGWTIVTDITNDRPMSPVQVIDSIPGQGKYTVTESNTVENSLTVSTSVSAGLEGIIMSMIGVDVSMSYSSTSESGIEITVDCPTNNNALIEWTPFYHTWEGYTTPSNDGLTISQPMTQGGKTLGEYTYRCYET